MVLVQYCHLAEAAVPNHLEEVHPACLGRWEIRFWAIMLRQRVGFARSSASCLRIRVARHDTSALYCA